MNPKYLVFLLLFVATSAVSQAPAALQQQVKQLYTACHDIDLTALTEMLCAAQDDTYQELDAYFLNDEQKFRYVQTNPKYNYGAMKTIDGKLYCLVTFRNLVRITYFKPIDASARQAELKARFDAQSISYDKTRNAFMIAYTARMAAISEDGKWKFAFADQTLPPVSQGCLSETIKKELGL